MNDIEVKVDIVLSDEQLKAVELCTDLTKRLVAVSGSAGTGKTTIIRKLHAYYKSKGISCALAAPTGKAARRITELTGIPAVTLHRLLEYGRPGEVDPETGKATDPTFPSRDQRNPLGYKVIIADEYAMVNWELHNNLIAALGSGGCLRAFGDLNQLPPIEEYGTVHDGNTDLTPFAKLLNKFSGVKLTFVYRQAHDSNVLSMANRICKGSMPTVNQDLGDWYVKLTDRPLDILKAHVRECEDAGKSFRLIENQVIVPTKKTWVGTLALNGLLRSMLNPNPIQALELKRHAWDDNRLRIGIGDKVVCTSNTYDMRNFEERFEEWDSDGKPYRHSYIPCPPGKQMLNGETGVVIAIWPDGEIEIDFGDRIVEVPSSYSEYWARRDTVIDTYPQRDIDLAYALTTHKCQGSEFNHVCYIINKSGYFTHSRQNFYTGVTRAAKSAFVITDQKSLQYSLMKVIT